MAEHADKLPTAESENRCPACGAAVDGGRAGCQALWDEIGAKAYRDLAYAAVRDLAFDSYCMQHLETYCRSAKSYAAHLTRLCCGLEYGGDPAVYAAIQRWLNGRVSLEKPEAPGHRGTLTVVDVWAAANGEAYQELVRAWADEVWAAYEGQHALAHRWIRAAVDG